jgi:hypothetical protein
MFDWFRPEQRALRRKVRLDRKCLEAGARRFLQSYLSADHGRKPQFYLAVEEATRECSPAAWSLLVIEDAKIAEATSEAAIQIVLQRQEHTGPTKDDPNAFVTDAYATVAVAYRRAAGTYVRNKNMQELGTAAVHLLTMATSYTAGQRDGSDQAQE